LAGRTNVPWGVALSGSGKNFLAGKKWRSLGSDSPREWKELLDGEDGCPLRSENNFPMGRKGIPREGESPPRRYLLKGRVKLWLRMCCVPKKKSLGIGCNIAEKGKWGFFR